MAPAAKVEEFNLSKTIEALRATRELDVNLSGIKALRDAVRQPDHQGWIHLQSYLTASPACGELSNIWEAQSTVKDPRVFPNLLLLIADIITAKPPPAAATAAATADARTATAAKQQPHGAAAIVAATNPSLLLDTAQNALINLALGRRLKSLYFALGSDSQLLTNAALQVLVAVAGHSGSAARGLVAAFDWSLPALGKVCRPPRERSADDVSKQQPGARGGGGAATSHKSESSSAAASWTHPNVLSRPRRAMFVLFCRTLLDAADHATLARLLPLRPLTSGLLHHLATDPPGQCLKTLRVLARRVLAPPAAAASAVLPPRIRAEPFGDAALAALAEVAGASDVAITSAMTAAAAATGSKSTDLSAAATLAAEAALEVLLMLCTDPANGLVSHGPVSTLTDAAGDVALAPLASYGTRSLATDAAPQHGPGTKRLLRLLPRLHPLDRLRHARLLTEIASRNPALGAEFASSLPYDLQPKVSSRWVAAMTLVTRLTEAAASAGTSGPLMRRLTAAATAGTPPPSFDSGLVRWHLRCCLPPALSKVALSRGIQHDRPVVQALTLDALAAMLRCVRQLSAAVLAGQRHDAASATVHDISGGGGGSGAAAAWSVFHRRLGAAVRARLPDLRCLLALHTAMEKQDNRETAVCQSAAAAAPAGGVKRKRKTDAVMAGRVGSVDEDEDDDLEAAEEKGKENDDEEGEGGDDSVLTRAVFGSATAADPGHMRYAVLLRVLEVLSCCCRVLPEAVVEMNFDPVKMLPQEILAVDEGQQLALLRLLAAAAGGPLPEEEEAEVGTLGTAAVLYGGNGGSGGGIGLGTSLPSAAAAAAAPLSMTLVTPLLRLLTYAASPAVRSAAGELLLHRCRPLLLTPDPLAASTLPTLPTSCATSSSPTPTPSPALWGLTDLELRLWLWLLPASPPSGGAQYEGHRTPQEEEGESTPGGGTRPGRDAAAVVAAAVRGAGCELGESGGVLPSKSAEAVMGFLSDLLVGVSRRPQDGYELLTSWGPPPPSSLAAGPQTTTTPATGELPFSPLPALALRNCLRLLRSARTGGAAERAAVAAYVAGVFFHLLQVLPDPLALLHVLEKALTTDNTTVTATTNETKTSPTASTAVGGTKPQDISLPAEAHPLVTLYEWAVRHWTTTSSSRLQTAVKDVGSTTETCSVAVAAAATATPREPSAKKQKRRKSAPAATVGDVVEGSGVAGATGGGSGAQGGLPWGLGRLCLRAGAASGQGNGGVAVEEDKDGDGDNGGDVARKVRVYVKAAAKALQKSQQRRKSAAGDCASGGGAGELPYNVRDQLAAAAQLASQLLILHCREPAAAAAHAVRLLHLAVRKGFADVASGGDSNGFDPWVSGGRNGGEQLLAALWVYVLGKPLAAHCLSMTDVLQMAAARRDVMEEDADDDVDVDPKISAATASDDTRLERHLRPPSLAAIESVTVGGRISRSCFGWDGPLMQLQLLQTTFRATTFMGRGFTNGATATVSDVHSSGGCYTQSAASLRPPSLAVLAAARSINFWMPHLNGDVSAVAASCDLVRHLLPSAAAGVAGAGLSSTCVFVSSRREALAACGALCKVLDSPWMLALLRPSRVSYGRVSCTANNGHRATCTATCRYVAALVTEVLGACRGRCGGGRLGSSSPLDYAWGPSAAAAVRVTCRQHVRTAVAALLAAVRHGDADARGDRGPGSENAEEVAVVLLPLVRYAGVRQLLPLTEELLTLSYGGGEGAVRKKATRKGPTEGEEEGSRRKRARRDSAGAITHGNDVEEPAADDDAALVTFVRHHTALDVGLRLAAALLAEPQARDRLGDDDSNACDDNVSDFSLRGLMCSSRSAHSVMAAGPNDASDDVARDDGRNGLRRIFVAVQSTLVQLASQALSQRGQTTIATAATEALHAGLRGPMGHTLALTVKEATLEACVRLAPYSAVAAAAAAAALALGPPALRRIFTIHLAPVVAAAEQQLPGTGRRLALARLLPAAHACVSATDVTCRTGGGNSDDNASFRAILQTFCDPLLSYAMRKVRKPPPPWQQQAASRKPSRKSRGDTSASSGRLAVEAGSLPADAVASLRQYSVPVLSVLLRLRASDDGSAADGAAAVARKGTSMTRDGSHDASMMDGDGTRVELLKTLSKLLPPGGMPLTLDHSVAEGDGATDPAGQPQLASSAEQLTLAEALLRGALADGGVGCDADLAALSAVLGTAAATISALYELGVTPSGVTGDVPQRRLLAAATRLLDGCLGDLLADTPDHIRVRPAFAAVSSAVQPLLAATVAHAGTDPAALRCVRRLLAALLPSAGGPTAAEDGRGGEAEEEEGQRAVLVGGAGSAKSEGEGGNDGAEESADEEEEGGSDGEEGTGSGDVSLDSEEAGDTAAGSSSDDDDDDEEEDGFGAAAAGDNGGEGASGSEENDEEEEGDGNRASVEEDISTEASEGPSEGEEEEEAEAMEQEEDEGEMSDGDNGDVEMRDAAGGAGGGEAVHDSGNGGWALSYGVVPNADVAAAASAMLHALVTSTALLHVFSPLTEPHPLPVAVSGMPLPLVSLMPLGAAIEPSLVAPPLAHSDALSVRQTSQKLPYASHGSNVAASTTADATGSPPLPSSPSSLSTAIRTEMATLLETLLDLRVAYDAYDQYGKSCGTDADDISGAAFGRSESERVVLGALLQLLQCAFGATLKECDRAVLRVMWRLDELLTLSELAPGGGASRGAKSGRGGTGSGSDSGSPSDDDDDEEEEEEEDGGGPTAVLRNPITRRLSGPLARSGFLWGPAAKAYYESAPAVTSAPGGGVRHSVRRHTDHDVITDATDAAASDGSRSDAALQALRARSLSEHHPPDPRTLGLACVRFPACRTLAADEDDPWVSDGTAAADGEVNGSYMVAVGATATAAVAADPAWILPFAVSCLRHGTATVQDLAGWGVMALCLRCLAADDVALRNLSYEALAAASAQLDEIAAAVTAAAAARSAGGSGGAGRPHGVPLAGPAAVGAVLPTTGPVAVTGKNAEAGPGGGGGGGRAAGMRVPTDFRQRQQLQALLAHVRNAVTAPLQQLPHCAALFAAEAAVVLLQPQAPMHKPVTRLISKRPALDLNAPPLFNRVLAAGAPGQRQEPVWALQLLRWAVLGPLDATICRRKFVAEVCTAMYGSKAAMALDLYSGGSGGGGSGGSGSVAAGGGGGGGCLDGGRLLPLRVVAALVARPSLGRHLVLHTGLAPWLAHIITSAVRELYGNQPPPGASTAASALGFGGTLASHGTLGSTLTAPRCRTMPRMLPLPAAADIALAALHELLRRRVCLRKLDGFDAVQQYSHAISALAAGAVSYNRPDLAARTCGLAAVLAAVLTPRRAQSLWRDSLTPSVLMQLYGTLLAAPVEEAVLAEWLRTWLQVVVLSSFPLPSTTPTTLPEHSSPREAPMAATTSLVIPQAGASALLPYITPSAVSFYRPSGPSSGLVSGSSQVHSPLAVLVSAAVGTALHLTRAAVPRAATTAAAVNRTFENASTVSNGYGNGNGSMSTGGVVKGHGTTLHALPGTVGPLVAAAPVANSAVTLSRGCLLWLASLASAGHELCGHSDVSSSSAAATAARGQAYDAVTLAELLNELAISSTAGMSSVTSTMTAGGEKEEGSSSASSSAAAAAAAAGRLVLLAHNVCQGVLRRETEVLRPTRGRLSGGPSSAGVGGVVEPLRRFGDVGIACELAAASAERLHRSGAGPSHLELQDHHQQQHDAGAEGGFEGVLGVPGLRTAAVAAPQRLAAVSGCWLRTALAAVRENILGRGTSGAVVGGAGSWQELEAAVRAAYKGE